MSRIHGFVDPDFAPVTEALRSVVHGWHDRRDRRDRRDRPGGAGTGGAAVAVYLHGELVVDAWTGVRTPAGDPWERDTVAMSFSTTKGVVSTVLHRLVDRGLVDYDTPVAHYWPEFAQAGKGEITVRQLLTHSAGMHGARSLVIEPNDILDWDRMTQRLAASAPAWEPGSRPGYQALTYGWLVGEVIRRVGGYASVSEAVRVEIADPIGGDGMFVGVPPADRHRLAALIGQPPIETPTGRMLDRFRNRPFLVPFVDAFDALGFGTLMLTEEVHEGEIPSANGAFTARSLARMYAGLVSPEAFPAPPLVSPATLASDRGADHGSRRRGGRPAPVAARIPPRRNRTRRAPGRVRTLRLRRLGSMGRPGERAGGRVRGEPSGRDAVRRHPFPADRHGRGAQRRPPPSRAVARSRRGVRCFPRPVADEPGDPAP